MVDMSFGNIAIKSRIHDYSLEFTSDINSILETYRDSYSIVDRNVLNLYENKISFPAESKRIILDANEYVKSWENIDKVIHNMIELGIKRNDKLVVIGGGTIQDIASFISSILFRGVNWIFLPTTLLAQCDSCIGSKTSINFKKYKNQLGTFYPAEKIFVDTSFLDTLTDKDILSGIGEIIKIYLIEGNQISHLKEHLGKKNFEPMIFNSLQFKKKFIELDEFDKKERNILNYGHTFGHALETLTDYAIPHGQAVLIGTDVANYLSYKLDYLSLEKYKEMNNIIRDYLPKQDFNEFDLDGLFDILEKDKKNIAGKLSLILTKGFGEMFKTFVEYNRIKDYIREYDSFYKEQNENSADDI
jgi:3-dehydroquinate synthase